MCVYTYTYTHTDVKGSQEEGQRKNIYIQTHIPFVNKHLIMNQGVFPQLMLMHMTMLLYT